MNFSGFNIWEVLVAAGSAFVIGAVWYGPGLFGKTWQRLVGLTDEALASSNLILVFGLSYILLVIAAVFLSFFVEITSMMGSNLVAGAIAGGFVSLVFILPAFGVNYLFARRPLKLYLIDGGYLLLAFIVMGMIIGLWT